MKYELGASPINWRNDDMPEVGSHISVDECMSEAATIGYTGIEMGASFPKEPAELQRMLARHELKLISGWYSMGLLNRSYKEEIHAMRSHYELLAALGSRVMVVAEVLGSTVHNIQNRSLIARHKMNDSEWKTFLTRLEDLARYMQDRNMPLSYHPHIGTVIESPMEIERLLNETQSVNLLYDTGHVYYAGGDPYKVLMDYLSRINHIHMKDVRDEVIKKVYAEGTSFMNGVLAGTFTVPSDGDIDFKPLVEVLRGSDYDGWMVVEAEQDPLKATPAEYAAKGYTCLKELLDG